MRAGLVVDEGASGRKLDGGPLRFRAALEKIMEEIAESGRKLTREMIAMDAGVARSAVYAWFAGKSVPRQQQVGSLAKLFSDGNDAIERRYLRSLLEAAEMPVKPLSPLEGAQDGSRETVIGVVIYDDDGVDQFFEEIMQAFAGFVAFPNVIKRIHFSDLESDIACGRVDIGIGLWETPDRLLALRFLGTPIVIGMGMVSFADAKDSIPTNGNMLDIGAVRLVMNTGQASYKFGQFVLGVPPHRIDECSYDAGSFVRALRAAYQTWKSDISQPPPFVLTDELMCLKIYEILLSEYAVDKSSVSSRPELLTNDSSASWARDRRLIAAYPRYNVSLCTKRVRNDEWHIFVEDAWRIFLRGNTTFLSEKYKDIYNHLSSKIGNINNICKEYSIGEIDQTKTLGNILNIFNHSPHHNYDVWTHIVDESKIFTRTTAQ